MDRTLEREGHGYCQAVDVLAQFLERDAMIHGDPNRHQQQTAVLKELRDDFVD